LACYRAQLKKNSSGVQISRLSDLNRKTEIEPGLQYGIIAYKEGDEFSPEMFDSLKETTPHQRLFFFVNDMKYKHNLAYFPFPLCFRDAEALFRFYNGELLIYVVIDMERVNDILASHGLAAKLSDRDHFSWKIVPLADEEGSWYISSHMIGRLAGEFVRLDWLLDNTVINGLGYDACRRFRDKAVIS
jgi:hypothetical protein